MTQSCMTRNARMLSQISVILAIVFCNTACTEKSKDAKKTSPAPATQSSTQPSADRPVIGVVWSEDGEFVWDQVQTATREASDQLQAEVFTVQANTGDDIDSSTNDRIREFINNDLAIMIIRPSLSDDLQQTLEDARAAGIGIILILDSTDNQTELAHDSKIIFQQPSEADIVIGTSTEQFAQLRDGTIESLYVPDVNRAITQAIQVGLDWLDGMVVSEQIAVPYRAVTREDLE